MTDIKPFIAQKLEQFAPVELSFARVAKKLPVICVTETGNVAHVVLNGEERVSKITLQLDIYAGTAEEAESISERVSRELTAAGLRRGFSQLFTDEDTPRRCMRFTCGIDEAEGRILNI